MKRLSLLALAGAMVAGIAAPRVWADDNNNDQDLRAEVAQLKAELARVEHKQDQTDAIQAQVQAQVDQEVLQDADRRSQLLDIEGVNAGWDIHRGFVVQSDDGAFLWHPTVIFQFRYIYDHRDAGKADNDGPDNTEGFEVRRAKFGFDGNIFTPDLYYRFQWQDTNNGGTPALEYAFVNYTFDHKALLGGDLAIQGGQYKNLLWHEESIARDVNQPFAERSMANALVGGNGAGPYIQGVSLLLQGNNTPWHGNVSFTDGDNSANYDFTNGEDVTGAVHTNYGASARVDYKAFGDWGDLADLTGAEAVHNFLDFGGGLDYTDEDMQSIVRGTADVQYTAVRNFNAFAALYGDHYDYRNDTAVKSGSQNSWGAVVQGGYFFTPAWQAVLRYSVARLDPDFPLSGRSIYHEVTGGVNWYLGPNGAWNNHAKLSFDVTYLPVGFPSGETGLDDLSSPNGAAEVVFRSQFQLYF